MTAGSPKTHQSRARRPPAGRRVWLFRAIAIVGVPALLFLALEGTLRLVGFGRPATFLIRDEKPGYYRTNPEFAKLFLPESFDLRPLNFRVAAEKPPGALRVVVLGESAAQGIPEPMFGFAPQLRAQLRAKHPGREIEVLNTGIVAINSHVVRQVARDLAPFEPDVFVIYLGNNEVVGPYAPGCSYLSDTPPLWAIRLSVFVRSTRIGQLVGAAIGRIASGRAPAPKWDGMAMFVDNAVAGDDPRLGIVYENFEENLNDILDTASACGAKVVLSTVVANLKDSAPFLSLHRPGLPDTERDKWAEAFERGRTAFELGELDTARTHFRTARDIDPQYADTSFLLGRVELAAGDESAARRHFVDALRRDALRFRPDPAINDIIRKVAGERAASVTLIDASIELGADPASTGEIAGRELLFEHVHFDWEGNHRLARLLAEGVVRSQDGVASGAGRWLGSAEAAAALAYTPHEQFPVLLKIEGLTRKPPFNNQLTFVDDMAVLDRHLQRAQAAFADEANLRAARDIVSAAIASDPDNPTLAGIARGVAIDLGDIEGALRHARRERELSPFDFSLSANEATLLVRLDRAGEARRILDAAAALAANPVLTAPAYADYFSRSARFDEGLRFLGELVERFPVDPKLPLMHANLAGLSGYRAAAEQGYRGILERHPENEDALEALVTLLRNSGRTAEVGAISLAMAAHQPGNHANNLRAGLAAESRGDDAAAVKYLEAAERSGAVNAALELRLARKLYRMGRLNDALLRLTTARRLAALEGDGGSVESIGPLIARLRAELD